MVTATFRRVHIDAVRLKNFRSFEDATIELRSVRGTTTHAKRVRALAKAAEDRNGSVVLPIRPEPRTRADVENTIKTLALDAKSLKENRKEAWHALSRTFQKLQGKSRRVPDSKLRSIERELRGESFAPMLLQRIEAERQK